MPFPLPPVVVVVPPADLPFALPLPVLPGWELPFAVPALPAPPGCVCVWVAPWLWAALLPPELPGVALFP